MPGSGMLFAPCHHAALVVEASTVAGASLPDGFDDLVGHRLSPGRPVDPT
jgi:hypothetical protein